MQKIILFVFKLNEKQMESVIHCVSMITTSKFVKFKIFQNNIVMNFTTDYDFDKVKQFIDMTLSDVTDSYFVSELGDNMSIILPNDETEQFLSVDSIEDYQEIDSVTEQKFIDEITENELEFLRNIITNDDEDDDDIIDDCIIPKKNLKPSFNLDEILDKINEKGIQSLTLTEQNYLKNFQKK